MLQLKHKTLITIIPLAPFNYKNTIYNPSHFPAPTEAYENGTWYQTMRFENQVLGLKMENQGTVIKPKIKLKIYSLEKLDKNYLNKLIQEIEYRFELDLDLSEFNQKFKNDKILGPVIRRRLGSRSKCGYSLYESLMVYIVLQNATVRRTVQMMNALLEKYGEMVSFDGRDFYVMWSPKALEKTSEQELRNLKVGYRAKFFKKISESFVKSEFNEMSLRNEKLNILRDKLLSLYGIGPASVGNLLWEVFHNHEVLDEIPPWEQKIYSRLLYHKELVPKDEILKDMESRWGKWKRLAAFYLWTDLFWRHKQKPISWLTKEIRL